MYIKALSIQRKTATTRIMSDKHHGDGGRKIGDNLNDEESGRHVSGTASPPTSLVTCRPIANVASAVVPSTTTTGRCLSSSAAASTALSADEANQSFATQQPPPPTRRSRRSQRRTAAASVSGRLDDDLSMTLSSMSIDELVKWHLPRNISMPKMAKRVPSSRRSRSSSTSTVEDGKNDNGAHSERNVESVGDDSDAFYVYM